MNDLTTLMRTASDQAPADRIDVDDLVRAGRSRVRRRRALVGVAAAAVAGIAGVVPLLPTGPDTTPAPSTQPGELLTLADATPARAGVDYDVLRTFTAHSTDKSMEGQFVRGVLPDGTVVVQSYPDGHDSAGRVGLVGPDGTRTVDAPKWMDNYLGGTQTAAIFGDSRDGGLWLLDVASLTWRAVLEGQDVDTNVPAQPLTTSPDRPNDLYFAASPTTDLRRSIFRADLGAQVASVITEGGDVAASGGHVAWTAAYDAPNDRVVVRDLATGDDTSFDPRTGDCVHKDLGVTGSRVVVMVNCADTTGDGSETDVVDRVDVFDLAGRPLTRITGDDLGPVRMTDRFLTITSWREGDAGTYTYDLDTGRFLRVAGSVSGLTGRETGSGSTLVWQKRLDGDTGATYVVAQMR